MKLRDRLLGGGVDFIDIGASKGGSIDFCRRRFDSDCGIGVDLNDGKLEIARSNGFEVYKQDVLAMDLPSGVVRFVSMMDFLEHLPNLEYAQAILERAVKWASQFIFIRHPSFEMIEYLKDLELKVTWTDWTGHKNMMMLNDFYDIFNQFGISDYVVVPRKPILNSLEPCVLPLCAECDSHSYEGAKHGLKKDVTFDRPIYKQYDIFVNLSLSEQEFGKLAV